VEEGNGREVEVVGRRWRKQNLEFHIKRWLNVYDW